MLPLEGGCDGDRRRRGVRARGPRRRLRRRSTDFVYVPRDARVEIASDGGGRVRAAVLARRPNRLRAAPRAPPTTIAVELRGAGPGEPPGQQLLRPRTAFAADRLIAVEVLTPARQLVLVPAAQARRGRPGRRDRARGDLLLRGRRAAATASPTSASTATGPGGRSTSSREVRTRRRDRACRTATTARRWPRPATTSTTST